MKVSAHFDDWELAQRAGYGLAAEPYPVEWMHDPTRLPKLLAAVEALRARWDRPMVVQSCWRSVEYNRRSYEWRGLQPTRSQHSEGRAMDLRVPGVPVAEVYATALGMARRGEVEVGGLGYYPGAGFVHVDVRVGWDHLALWTDYGG